MRLIAGQTFWPPVIQINANMAVAYTAWCKIAACS